MIVTKLKPLKEILNILKEVDKIFLIGCGGCAEACETGGEPQVRQLEQELKEKGKQITGWVVIDFLCNKALVGMRLAYKLREISKADCLLVLSCGVGVQAVAATVDKLTFPALDTISLGGFQGTWPSSERCYQCGECILYLTGGICPLTACAKHLLNGSCGGSDKGKCEVHPDRDCAWYLIYERLKKVGRLDILRKIAQPKNYNKMEASQEIRTSTYWALEFEETKDESA